jgi:DNA-binding Lrp family transcriptional regulator
MALAYVLVVTKPGTEKEVYLKMKKYKEITDLHPLFGEYDIIAKIETDDFNKIGAIVVDKIRTIDGVVDTKTHTGINF